MIAYSTVGSKTDSDIGHPTIIVNCPLPHPVPAVMQGFESAMNAGSVLVDVNQTLEFGMVFVMGPNLNI